ncbi:hypothetical protein EDB92DRAFT_319637 [Lactarius akahatsu]|uniref:Uncharacterized protein n=1 Tax=Lactarius akahatsu TaxID=416441 RepID=A0AAD4LJG4_9AGAM|nr:hypothetical protein EDB92DRAFT_319637 [Lactarius akahatsu]
MASRLVALISEGPPSLISSNSCSPQLALPPSHPRTQGGAQAPQELLSPPCRPAATSSFRMTFVLPSSTPSTPRRELRPHQAHCYCALRRCPSRYRRLARALGLASDLVSLSATTYTPLHSVFGDIVQILIPRTVLILYGRHDRDGFSGVPPSLRYDSREFSEFAACRGGQVRPQPTGDVCQPLGPRVTPLDWHANEPKLGLHGPWPTEPSNSSELPDGTKAIPQHIPGSIFPIDVITVHLLLQYLRFDNSAVESSEMHYKFPAPQPSVPHNT